MKFKLIDDYSGKVKTIEANSLDEAENIALNQSHEIFTWSIFKSACIFVVYNDIIVSCVYYFSDDPILRQNTFIKLNHLEENLKVVC